jgi:exodeoxyribonuclease V alpha subunit
MTVPIVEKERLRGTIVATKYRNADGTWAVVQIRVVGADGKLGEIVTAKGFIPRSSREEVLEFIGSWINDKDYGLQFDVVDAFPQLPNTAEEIQAYLGKHMKGSGVGPAKAKALVEHFGTEIVRIISEEPARLIEVKGITARTIDRIKRVWSEECKNRPAEMWLAMHGVSRAMSRRLINHYGNKVTEVLQENPYRATDVDGFGFKTADELAQAMGWPRQSPERTEAALVFVLQESTNKGHAFLHHGQIIEQTVKTSERPESEVLEALEKVLASGKIAMDEADSGSGFKLRAYYLPYLLRAERELASRVAELVEYPHEVPGDLEIALAGVQRELDVPFSPLQVQGIRAAFEKHVSIVTGGPGTGKSTLVRGLVRLAERLHIPYFLAAPTGRAAKRLSEVTEREARTIHRMLEFDPVTFSFTRNRNNPLQADMIIVDEGSMLELVVGRSLLEAVPDNATLVIIGDVDQLPAVGPGMVLKDLIESKVITVTRLTTIFRQAVGSRIITNAHRIRAGEMPQFPEVKGVESDSYLMKVPRTYDEEKRKSVDDMGWVREMLIRLCSREVPNRLGVDPIRDIQVLLPMKVGDAGSRELNGVLQRALNPHGEEIEVPGGIFRIGDRVMQFKNNYKLDVFNGDIGFVHGWNEEEGCLIIDFYGRMVDYPEESTRELQLAYAQTIHKAQGSEYPVTIIVLVSQHYVMLERNLIYTANTRAKRMCLYVASEWAIKTAVQNNQVTSRNSFLAARIRGAVQLEVSA